MKVPTLKIDSRVFQGFASKETIEKELLHERSAKDREK
ncbi:hypothetical protein SRABI82_01681 [Priestia megaterium]|nr:hypothetical protein SRABI82_01681 [Priestia megaterium]